LRPFLRKDFGDVQTPAGLVDEILGSLFRDRTWSRVLEPTCGDGNFIAGLLRLGSPPTEIRGFDIQAYHVAAARSIVTPPTTTLEVEQANIFDLDLRENLKWDQNLPGLLVVGNPPWVLNATLGALGSSNLPHKANIRGLRGIDALTGRSNFDIAEYIWLKLIAELQDEEPTIALLSKTSVARNVIEFTHRHRAPVANARIHQIDARKWFGVAADACLLQLDIRRDQARYEIQVYPDFATPNATQVIGFAAGRIVADMKAYGDVSHFDGQCPVTWRQGVKHDAADVMELRCIDGGLRNKCGEMVDVESEHIYPLLKSTAVSQANRTPGTYVIVTQKALSEDTQRLQREAPRLWTYLESHEESFSRRKSSIYRGRPPFSMFGIGEYTFSPYKVAVSGLHKRVAFHAIGTVKGRPILLDDTCYFVSCQTPLEAAVLAGLLNNEQCTQLLKALVFSDAKRPVTKSLLQRMDLRQLFLTCDQEALLAGISRELKAISASPPALTKSAIESVVAGWGVQQVAFV